MAKELHLVSYDGRDSFEVDLSELDDKDLSILGRKTLFVFQNTSWEVNDKELDIFKKSSYWRWCFVHVKPEKKVEKLVAKVSMPVKKDSIKKPSGK